MFIHRFCRVEKQMSETMKNVEDKGDFSAIWLEVVFIKSAYSNC